MKTKLIIGFIAIAVVALASWNIIKNQHETAFSELVLANIKALANDEGLDTGESGGMQTIYVRKTSDCWIYGNGKVSIAGKGILEVDGSLCLADYQVSCESGGKSSCKNVECAEIWGWVD